jgi:putative FmdB family regulatory protein
MYEYECKQCGASFDMMRGIHQSDDDIVCAICGSISVQRKFSVFAAVSKDSSGFSDAAASFGESGGSCGSGGCCGGSCSLN